MKLVIVESPAKAKTIAKYLGKGYEVEASKGHIMDLPEKTMGVDVEHNYTPIYKIKTKEQKETVNRLKAKVSLSCNRPGPRRRSNLVAFADGVKPRSKW